MDGKLAADQIAVGVIGLGLMGSSIVVALLNAGHQVTALAPTPEDWVNGANRIEEQLHACERGGFLQKDIKHYKGRLTVTKSYEDLSGCCFIMECVIENEDIKQSVYKKITDVVDKTSIIASNTSAIPISKLQANISAPERFMGVHWAEPAFATRFLEITCGAGTSMATADWVYDLAHQWGKEPTLLKKDIRGFITNRLMYAVYREALYIMGTKGATMEDIDKAFRYDAGSWITLMGIFRRMDFIGLGLYQEVFKRIMPTLCNDENVPAIMQGIVADNGRGIHNLKGLYPYTAVAARAWNEAFADFNKDISVLASSYGQMDIPPLKSGSQVATNINEQTIKTYTDEINKIR